jgi:hypothetical protein
VNAADLQTPMTFLLHSSADTEEPTSVAYGWLPEVSYANPFNETAEGYIRTSHK